MGYINISDGSITPTPPPYDGPDDLPMYVADEQFANVYWQWGRGDWAQHSCPAGMIFDPHVQPGRCASFLRTTSTGHRMSSTIPPSKGPDPGPGEQESDSGSS